jgi:hypothetical protein
MASPFVATSRLSNIIQMITLSRQSGILRVIRGHGPTRELGQIRFVNGEPAAALLGHMVGMGALNALGNWGECQYAFDESAGGETDDPMLAVRQGQAPLTGPLPSMPNPSASWPPYGYQYPPSGPQGPMSPLSPLPGESSPFAGSGPQTPGQGYPAWSGGYPANYPPNYPPAQTRPALGFPGDQPPAGMPGPQGAPTWGQPAAVGLLPEHLRVVPQRTPAAEQLDQLPLDRRERMVLLLVDGQRNLSDLARLTRRSEQELYSVLAHLEMLGLVRLRG